MRRLIPTFFICLGVIIYTCSANKHSVYTEENHFEMEDTAVIFYQGDSIPLQKVIKLAEKDSVQAVISVANWYGTVVKDIISKAKAEYENISIENLDSAYVQVSDSLCVSLADSTYTEVIDSVLYNEASQPLERTNKEEDFELVTELSLEEMLDIPKADHFVFNAARLKLEYWIEKGEKLNIQDILFTKSIYYMITSRESEGLELMIELAENGYTQSCLFLAFIYEEEDPASMIYYLEKAVEFGDNDAPFMLFNLYNDGEIVEYDFDKAFNYLEIAAMREHPQSQLILAYFYYGRNNFPLAKYWIREFRKSNEHSDEIIDVLWPDLKDIPELND